MMASGPNLCTTMLLAGDVMTGRGIDQILPHAGSPILHEPWVRDAREYIRLAEDANGPITRPVDPAYIWGDALVDLHAADVRIVNLETSITTSEDYWPGKEVHYRMHPGNIECITAARIDCCCLANNHVMDWGYAGLAQTLQALDQAGVAHPGAGANLEQAAAPTALDLGERGRVLVFSLGSETSGIPPSWAAGSERPGVNLLPDLSEDTAWDIAGRVHQVRQPGDVVIVSIHWGANWGYEVPDEQVRFARRLAAEGIDIVHGHSSHHVKAIEVWRDRLILYGCGDLLTDYEGIHGQEMFRGDLGLLYRVQVDRQQGRIVEVRLVPTRMGRLQLNRASAADARWLCDLLNRQSPPRGTHAELKSDNSMLLQW